ncbi:MAG: diacylglycerol kinase family lipid kinase [Candidatus Dadabacteria bacterium]|nr:MAG: diacylglycerol kinase family lipid kinase [Candidatus Dadabacteria bacterium]
MAEILGGFKKIHLIINPVSGQGVVPVEEIRSKFNVLGDRLTVHETKADVSARTIVEEAVSKGADLVVAFGGDGTMLQVAEGLINTGVPLGVIPGGTANVFASELEIPNDKMKAIDLLINKETHIRKIDVGCVGEKHFLLRLGIGLEAAMTVMTDREEKDKYGFWAYLWTALRVGSRMKQAHYHMVIDGKRKRVKGVTCVICNSGNLGLPRVKLLPDIDVSDGKLDVVVVREASLWTAASLIYHAVKGVFSKAKPHGDRPCYSIFSRQAKEVVVMPVSHQLAARDGEDVGSDFPLKITLKHNALLVLAPEVKGFFE